MRLEMQQCEVGWSPSLKAAQVYVQGQKHSFAVTASPPSVPVLPPAAPGSTLAEGSTLADFAVRDCHQVDGRRAPTRLRECKPGTQGIRADPSVAGFHNSHLPVSSETPKVKTLLSRLKDGETRAAANC